MQIAVAQIWIIEIFFNNIIEIILPDFVYFHNENEKEVMEIHIPPHRDPENKKPRH